MPGRPWVRPTHARWLKQYQSIVQEGAWAYLDVGDSDLFPEALPENGVVSVFANRKVHLVQANYGANAVSIETRDPYVPLSLNTAQLPQHTGPSTAAHHCTSLAGLAHPSSSGQ